MKFSKPLALGLVAGLAAAAFATAVPAFSDPVANSYVLVGSDTLQDSANALTNGTNLTGSYVRIKADGATLGNFDAFPKGSTIQAKSGGPFFVRPSGSGDGVKALSASIQNTTFNGVAIGGQVDIARSSSGPSSNANADGKLMYIPYARDAVSYAYIDSAGKLGSLTTAQLKAIYEANTPTVIDGVTVKPLIPQTGSGTRSFFLTAIGVTTLGSQVSSAYNGTDNTLPENNAGALTQEGQIVPFSAASWIAQSNGAAPSTITGNTVKLGSTNGIAPYSGSGNALVPNSSYYNTSYGRDTYLVVERARITPGDAKYDPILDNLVDPTSNTSLTNFDDSPTSAGAVKQKSGFLAPSSQVGIPAYVTLP